MGGGELRRKIVGGLWAEEQVVGTFVVIDDLVIIQSLLLWCRKRISILMKKLLLILLLLLVFVVACDEEYDDDEYYDEESYADPVDEEDAEEAYDDEMMDDGDETAAATASYSTNDCPFDAPSNADIECGTLTVPENRTKANSPMIKLAVAIIYADDGSGNVPMVYLEGGPGGSPLATFNLEDWEDSYSSGRDLILMDQRGTGYSYPSLNCTEYDEDADDPDADCQERLADEGIDLTAYNTMENAADFADLRLAMDIDEWDVLGVSYGTRLALALMRDHPEGIRSVVLDSPFPPNANTAVDEINTTYDLMHNLFNTCAEDSFCNENYPDLEAVFLQTVADLNENGDEIIGDDLVVAISGAMQNHEPIPFIPYTIYEVSEGNLEALDDLQEGYYNRFAPHRQDNESIGDSEGMFNSVMCHDEFAFGSYDATETAVSNQIPEEIVAGLLQSSAQMFDLCDYWGAGLAKAIEDQAVVSDIPTLILVGEFDTATPPVWAELTAATLSNSYLFQFPGSGHSLLTMVPCSATIAADFLADPMSQPNDSCIQDIEWPYFE